MLLLTWLDHYGYLLQSRLDVYHDKSLTDLLLKTVMNLAVWLVNFGLFEFRYYILFHTKNVFKQKQKETT